MAPALIFVFGLVLVIAVLALGEPGIQALGLWLTGTRPTGWLLDALNWAYLIVMLPLAVLVGLVLPLSSYFVWLHRLGSRFRMAPREQRTPQSTPALVVTLVVALAAVVGPVGLFVVPRVGATVSAALHQTTWPEDLAVTGYSVCADRIQFDRWGLRMPPDEALIAARRSPPNVTWAYSNRAWGRISLTVTNRASSPLREGRFTVLLGVTPFLSQPLMRQVRVPPIPSGESRRIELRDVELGNIWPPDSRSRANAVLLWDRVTWDTNAPPRMSARRSGPTAPIVDCDPGTARTLLR